jgi:hypothetical protein
MHYLLFYEVVPDYVTRRATRPSRRLCVQPARHPAGG